MTDFDNYIGDAPTDWMADGACVTRAARRFLRVVS